MTWGGSALIEGRVLLPLPSQHRPSLSSVHIALTQLGYQMVAQNGEMRWYQLQEHTEVNLFLDLGELTTFEDLSRALAKNGENPDAFFAMYEPL